MHWWAIRTGTFDEIASGHAPTLPEARRAALTALLTILDTARAEVVGAMDNLDHPEP